MQIHAVERWLDEGWSPWRIGYGTANLIALLVALYQYAKHPHHPGAVWWLLAAVALTGVWALLEMLRWRIRYRRLLASHQASAPEARQPISKLLTDGKELRANIGNHMSWWGTNRLLPNGAPGRIVRWEGNIDEALINQPEIRTLFRKAPDLDVNKPTSGQAYGRLEYELKILESATSDGLEGFSSDSDPSAIARVEEGLAAYYGERVERLHELHNEGAKLLNVIGSSGERDELIASALLKNIRSWGVKVEKELKYWPDINTFGGITFMGLAQAPTIGKVHGEVEYEVEALQTAINRL
ncbi:MAG: hypothetical protein ACLP52_29280 [Streptosporangiaceae bacterium]